MKSLFVKITCLLVIVGIICFSTSCTDKETLLFLNWGEYINDDLVTKFEEEYNCNVIVDLTDSNELFYAKLKSGTTAYDLTCPGDYMIEKMIDNNLLQELKFNLLPNYNKDNFITTLQDLMNQLDADDPSRKVNNYHVPYFWGSFGLMYNKNYPNIEQTLADAKEDGKEWDALFDPTFLGTSAKRGMYNVSRFVYAASMLAKNEDPNGYSEENLTLFSNVLDNASFNNWATDQLKKAVQAGNLDIDFCYTGDCLDMIYVKISDGVALEDMTFDICVPTNTILHMDSLVIPKNARHVELAHAFMNFMLDPDNAYENASVVGYCTPLKQTYSMIVNKVGITDDTSEEDRFWYENWGNTVAKYYPVDDDGNMLISGTVLTYFSKDQLTSLENIVIRAKAKQS